MGREIGSGTTEKTATEELDIEEFIGKFTTESVKNFDGPCENIPVCNGPVCRAKCDAEAGIYADSRDCRSFCECSGHKKRRNSSLKKCQQGTLFDQELQVWLILQGVMLLGLLLLKKQHLLENLRLSRLKI